MALVVTEMANVREILAGDNTKHVTAELKRAIERNRKLYEEKKDSAGKLDAQIRMNTAERNSLMPKKRRLDEEKARLEAAKTKHDADSVLAQSNLENLQRLDPNKPAAAFDFLKQNRLLNNSTLQAIANQQAHAFNTDDAKLIRANVASAVADADNVARDNRHNSDVITAALQDTNHRLLLIDEQLVAIQDDAGRVRLMAAETAAAEAHRLEMEEREAAERLVAGSVTSALKVDVRRGAAGFEVATTVVWTENANIQAHVYYTNPEYLNMYVKEFNELGRTIATYHAKSTEADTTFVQKNALHELMCRQFEKHSKLYGKILLHIGDMRRGGAYDAVFTKASSKLSAESKAVYKTFTDAYNLRYTDPVSITRTPKNAFSVSDNEGTAAEIASDRILVWVVYYNIIDDEIRKAHNDLVKLVVRSPGSLPITLTKDGGAAYIGWNHTLVVRRVYLTLGDTRIENSQHNRYADHTTAAAGSSLTRLAFGTSGLVGSCYDGCYTVVVSSFAETTINGVPERKADHTVEHTFDVSVLAECARSGVLYRPSRNFFGNAVWFRLPGADVADLLDRTTRPTLFVGTTPRYFRYPAGEHVDSDPYTTKGFAAFLAEQKAADPAYSEFVIRSILTVSARLACVEHAYASTKQSYDLAEIKLPSIVWTACPGVNLYSSMHELLEHRYAPFLIKHPAPVVPHTYTKLSSNLTTRIATNPAGNYPLARLIKCESEFRTGGVYSGVDKTREAALLYTLFFRDLFCTWFFAAGSITEAAAAISDFASRRYLSQDTEEKYGFRDIVCNTNSGTFDLFGATGLLNSIFGMPYDPSTEITRVISEYGFSSHTANPSNPVFIGRMEDVVRSESSDNPLSGAAVPGGVQRAGVLVGAGLQVTALSILELLRQIRADVARCHQRTAGAAYSNRDNWLAHARQLVSGLTAMYGSRLVVMAGRCTARREKNGDPKRGSDTQRSLAFPYKDPLLAASVSDVLAGKSLAELRRVARKMWVTHGARRAASGVVYRGLHAHEHVLATTMLGPIVPLMHTVRVRPDSEHIASHRDAFKQVGEKQAMNDIVPIDLDTAAAGHTTDSLVVNAAQQFISPIAAYIKAYEASRTELLDLTEPGGDGSMHRKAKSGEPIAFSPGSLLSNVFERLFAILGVLTRISTFLDMLGEPGDELNSVTDVHAIRAKVLWITKALAGVQAQHHEIRVQYANAEEQDEKARCIQKLLCILFPAGSGANLMPAAIVDSADHAKHFFETRGVATEFGDVLTVLRDLSTLFRVHGYYAIENNHARVADNAAMNKLSTLVQTVTDYINEIARSAGVPDPVVARAHTALAVRVNAGDKNAQDLAGAKKALDLLVTENDGARKTQENSLAEFNTLLAGIQASFETMNKAHTTLAARTSKIDEITTGLHVFANSLWGREQGIKETAALIAELVAMLEAGVAGQRTQSQQTLLGGTLESLDVPGLKRAVADAEKLLISREEAELQKTITDEISRFMAKLHADLDKTTAAVIDEKLGEKLAELRRELVEKRSKFESLIPDIAKEKALLDKIEKSTSDYAKIFLDYGAGTVKSTTVSGVRGEGGAPQVAVTVISKGRSADGAAAHQASAISATSVSGPPGTIASTTVASGGGQEDAVLYQKHASTIAGVFGVGEPVVSTEKELRDFIDGITQVQNIRSILTTVKQKGYLTALHDYLKLSSAFEALRNLQPTNAHATSVAERYDTFKQAAVQAARTKKFSEIYTLTTALTNLFESTSKSTAAASSANPTQVQFDINDILSLSGDYTAEECDTVVYKLYEKLTDESKRLPSAESNKSAATSTKKANAGQARAFKSLETAFSSYFSYTQELVTASENLNFAAVLGDRYEKAKAASVKKHLSNAEVHYKDDIKRADSILADQ